MELATTQRHRNGGPTLEHPDQVLVKTMVGGQELPLSHAEVWCDGEGYVVRSLEFDCVAEGDDFNEALNLFGRTIYSYADTLRTRVDHDTATETERQMLQVLSERLSRIYLAERRGRERRKSLFRRLRSERPGRQVVSA